MVRWRLRLFWGLVLALGVAFSLHQYLSGLRQTVTVVVAARDIPARTPLQPDMVRVVQVGRAERDRLVPDGISRPEEVTGYVAAADLRQGDVLRHDPRLVTAGTDALTREGEVRLAAFLPTNGRAVMVHVDAPAALAGRVKRGDRVDVAFTSKDNSTGGVYSALVLACAHVLEVEPAGEGGGRGYHVTLLVTPAQALDLHLAKRRGSIDLGLCPTLAEPEALPPASPLKFARAPGE